MLIELTFDPSVFWLTFLPILGLFSGLGSAIGGLFGGSGGFDEVIGFLRGEILPEVQTSLTGFREAGVEARQAGIETREIAGGLRERGLAAFEAPPQAPDIAAARQRLLGITEGGISPFAQLQFEDLNKLLTEAAVSTGNLRSGAVQIGRAELGRRIAADEFGRALTAFDAIRRGDIGTAQSILNLSLGLSNVSLGLSSLEPQFGQLEVGALDALLGTGRQISGALLGRGALDIARAQALGGAIGAGVDIGLAGVTGGLTGSEAIGQTFNPEAAERLRLQSRPLFSLPTSFTGFPGGSLQGQGLGFNIPQFQPAF